MPPIDLRAGAGSVPGTGATRSGRGSAQVEAAFSGPPVAEAALNGPPVAEAALPVVSGEEATLDGLRGGETLPRGPSAGEAALDELRGGETLPRGTSAGEATVGGLRGGETLPRRPSAGEATVGGARREESSRRAVRNAARESEEIRLAQVRARAHFLMDALGQQELETSLRSRGWDFAFDRAKKRLGSCQFTRSGSGGKRITLSRYLAAWTPLDYVDPNGLRLVEDVILHEIAHAIDFEQRGRSDHGPRWKSICQRVGADPARTYSGWHLPQSSSKYTATCPNCKQETRYYRAPTAAPACGTCCRTYNRGRYTVRYRLRIRRNY